MGDPTLLPAVRYCITLDSDTRLPRDAAKTLIGIIAHPLNRPVVDPSFGRVTEGYGILQPRVSVTMASAAGSLFARLYAGHTGVDPYTTAVSDTYQDLFGEGIFTGKGLYDVDAFIAALDGRVPEYALLSHDLFEGIYARTALVTDIELVDDYPASVLAHARRQHRWVRGDWQILRWLFPWVRNRAGELERNRLPLISRWKILDNLRRSLVPPATTALLLAGLDGSARKARGVDRGGDRALSFPVYPLLLHDARRPRGGSPGASSSAPRSTIWRPRSRASDCSSSSSPTRPGRWSTRSPSRSCGWSPSGGCSSGRPPASSAARAERRGSARPASVPPRDGGEPADRRRRADRGARDAAGGAAVAAPILLLWLMAPLLAYLLSRPVAPRSVELDDEDRRYLEGVAHETWHYFATFADPDEHGLPPDNFQEVPEPRIAHRTSPTNIGMGLLATLAAHDLGFHRTDELIERIDATLTTIERLERHEGHLLNWYDSQTLAPLLPRYVSTVDSGNLAGALLCLAEGLRRLARPRAQTTVTAPSTPPSKVHRVPRVPRDPRARRARRVTKDAPAQRPGGACRSLRRGDALRLPLRPAAPHLRHRLPARRRREPGAARPLLLRPARFRGATRQLPRHRHGEVPQSHWFHLGRLVTSVDGSPTLLSWSATLFEYLMPLLFMRSYPETLLDETCRMAVRAQRRYAGERGVPWGISESACNVVDRHDTYQYKAFGVPGLGLKRGLGDELVVAPYATALAAMVEPAQAVRNLRRLAAQGLAGEYGFYEAIDYTQRARE